ncbi:MAG: Holliday junction branch migration protein RuvA [Rhodospirillaceae bacterium]|nr:Holliday junction branch migration protein RuvA [Rhodospirillaceae bacterium]
MIARLKGRIEAVGTDTAVIDVNGVGYLVHASSRTLGMLVPGEAVSLFIETHVREDHINLYGFLGADEQDWFQLLTTVQGVGAKVALAMLSALTGDMLMQAIASGDKAAVCRAPGVGPKLAQRILNELKDKVGAMALGPAAAGAGKAGVAASPDAAPAAGGDAAGDLLRDAASALVNLGYSPSEALAAVSRAAQASEESLTLEALIRAGLAELAPAENRRGA